MSAVRRMVQVVGNWPALRLDLIRHDIPERDRGWFALCRLQQLTMFPWFVGDLVRSGLSLWLLLHAPTPVIAVAGGLLASTILIEVALHGAWQRRPADPHKALANAQAFLLYRGIVWSIIVALLVRYAEANIGVVMFFALAALLFDILCSLAIPVIGLATTTLFVLSTAAALIETPGIEIGPVLAVSAMAVLGMHYGLFNLHYLFATRRLRTRELRSANETIQALLSQYDEHGNDCLVETDRQGRLQRPSSRLCQILGRSAEELEGIDIASLFEPGRQRDAMLTAARRQHRFRCHVVPLAGEGERRWWSMSGCAVFDQDGAHQGYRVFAQDVTEQRAAEEQVRYMATRDTLTGLANRNVLTTRLAQVLTGGGRMRPCAVLFIDLDSFKLVNDSYGHAAGDAVLVATATRLESLLSGASMAARIGGDEFAVLVERIPDATALMQLGADLVEVLSEPVTRDGVALPCGASIGMAMAPEHGRSVEALLRAADIALYDAKSRGRGTSVLFYSDLLTELQDRRNLEIDLRAALERGELELHYQPLIDIPTGRTVGYEALLRWNHPERGPVPPSLFIPLAEESNLIIPIGQWVLHSALAQAATWRDELTVAVNVSAAQMRGGVLLTQVMSALATSGLAPGRLELEITETLLMHESESHMRTLHRLRAMGARIALDDFGTGYSSLNYLRRFPFDKLKIDRSFVSDIVEEPDSRAIVETVLALAGKFRMETIAEGVESEAQLAALAAMGCQQAQGFLFDMAMPASRIPAGHRKAAGHEADTLGGRGTNEPRLALKA